MARKCGASVEVEIGSMGARESGVAVGESILYTDSDEAKEFVENTGIDTLACVFDTAHGLYAKEPKLDFPKF